MIEAVEELLESHANGRLSRRDAALRVMGLAMAALGVGRTGAAAAAGAPTFKTEGINHLALRVSDVARSRDFYRQHLGMTVIRDNSPALCFMRAGEHYLGLFRSSRPGSMDHYSLTVEGYEAAAAVERLTAAGFESRVEEDRVYFDDPDGIEIQLDSRYGSWPGPPPR